MVYHVAARVRSLRLQNVVCIFGRVVPLSLHDSTHFKGSRHMHLGAHLVDKVSNILFLQPLGAWLCLMCRQWTLEDSLTALRGLIPDAQHIQVLAVENDLQRAKYPQGCEVCTSQHVSVVNTSLINKRQQI
jgi:hypothetical protein